MKKMMKHALCTTALLMSLFTAVSADEVNKTIDYAGFAKLTRELNGVRQSRRISEEKFFEHSGRAEVVILDL